jgi:hypothetical protein
MKRCKNNTKKKAAGKSNSCGSDLFSIERMSPAGKVEGL